MVKPTFQLDRTFSCKLQSLLGDKSGIHQPNMVHYSAISRGQTFASTACNPDRSTEPNHILHSISRNYRVSTSASQSYIILSPIRIYVSPPVRRLSGKLLQEKSKKKKQPHFHVQHCPTTQAVEIMENPQID